MAIPVFLAATARLDLTAASRYQRPTGRTFSRDASVTPSRSKKRARRAMVKRVIDKDPQTPVNIVYSPSMVGTAIEVTALHSVTKLPMNGTYIVDSPLMSPENATQYYFPNSPY